MKIVVGVLTQSEISVNLFYVILHNIYFMRFMSRMNTDIRMSSYSTVKFGKNIFFFLLVYYVFTNYKVNFCKNKLAQLTVLINT